MDPSLNLSKIENVLCNLSVDMSCLLLPFDPRGSARQSKFHKSILSHYRLPCLDKRLLLNYPFMDNDYCYWRKEFFYNWNHRHFRLNCICVILFLLNDEILDEAEVTKRRRFCMILSTFFHF